MPSRIIRESLLDSDRWLALPDNSARLAFIVLLLRADDFGNTEANQARLCRWWRDFGIDTPPKVAAILQSLADANLIILYDVGGKPCLHVPKFGQRMRHHRRAIPVPPWQVEEYQRVTAKTTDARQTDDRRTTVVRRPEVEVEVEVEPRNTSRASRSTRPTGFDAFWSAYPKKRDKGKAEKAWNHLNPNEQLRTEIGAGLTRAKNDPQWLREAGRFIPYPATWLNAKGWLDVLEYAYVHAGKDDL
jgi:hypothetical protein